MGRAWAATATPRWPTSPPTTGAVLRRSTTSPACSPSKSTPTPRLSLYLNYGGDYAGRADLPPTPPRATHSAARPYCRAELLPAHVGRHLEGAPSAAAVGYGSRLLSNSACLTIATPGYNGSSTGYYPGGSCGAQTRDVQEITGGYWYDIYKGDHGRLRQGLQYGYAVREGWSGSFRHRRQGHRQHVLDQLPLLPPLTRRPSGSDQAEGAAQLTGCPFRLLDNAMRRLANRNAESGMSPPLCALRQRLQRQFQRGLPGRHPHSKRLRQQLA